jgi:hypothetical protein
MGLLGWTSWLAACQGTCPDPMTCDVDGDGVIAGDDCDDADADVGGALPWFGDCDADGVAGDITTLACEKPEAPPCDAGDWNGADEPRGDCDDADGAVVAEAVWYPDCDGDGARGEGTDPSCGPPNAWCDAALPIGGWTDVPPGSFDCDDTDSARQVDQVWYPDCDGDGEPAATGPLDCAPPDDWCDAAPPTGGWWDRAPAVGDCDDADVRYTQPVPWYPDCDGDGAPSAAGPTACAPPDDWCDGAPPAGGWFDLPPSATDCDDAAAGTGGPTDWYPDCDGDGVFGAAGFTSCDPPVACGPGGPHGGFRPVAGDDCDDLDAGAVAVTSWAVDCDHDGYFADTRVASCGPPGAATCGGATVPGSALYDTAAPRGDCDDFAAGSSPGAIDVCGDGLDQDCSGADRACPPPIIDLTPTASNLKIIGAQPGDAVGVLFGDPPIVARDLDADGDVDLVIGSPDPFAKAHSKVHVVYGPITADVDLATVTTRIEGAAGECLGTYLDVGDLDGDDTLDLVVNDSCYSELYFSRVEPYGRLFGFLGLPSAPTPSSARAFQILPPNVLFDGVARIARVGVGDFVGDGRDDIVVQGAGTPSDTATIGDVWVVETPAVASTRLVVPGLLYGQETRAFGNDVFGRVFAIDRRDVDANGFDRLFVTGIYTDPVPDDPVNGTSDHWGAVMRFDGPFGFAPGPGFERASAVRLGVHRCARFGNGVDLADVTGDGDPEVLVSAQPNRTTFPATGDCPNAIGPSHAVALDPDFAGASALAPAELQDRTYEGDAIAMFGSGPKGIGDFNGDGLPDVAVGDVDPNTGSLTVHVLLGPWDHHLDVEEARYRVRGGGTYNFQYFTSADVDDDGFSDLLFPTPDYPTASDRRGAVFVVRGRPDP